MSITVETKDVTRVYEQGKVKVHALNGVSLQIQQGEFTALVGPSGSGKTTLLNMIGGLDRPTSGTVRVGAHDLGSLSKHQLSILRRDELGFVFQAYNLVPVLTAEENAGFILGLQGVPKKKIRERVHQTLRDLGLQGFESRMPDELSGGQQQRVAVARAIVSHPKIVLADEPTANLDSKSAEALLDTMAHLNHEKGLTFLFSTHDERVMERASRIITLVDGEIESDELSE